MRIDWFPAVRGTAAALDLQRVRLEGGPGEGVAAADLRLARRREFRILASSAAIACGRRR
jgi:hypothetical protein